MGGGMIKPWELYPEFWKTEAMFLSYIRGGIRRHLWAKNPVKLEFIKRSRKMINNPNPRSAKGRPKVWGGVCECCGKEFATKDMEVDHKTGEFNLRKIEDIQKFVEGIVFVRYEDLALLCKPCHKAKTYAERTGMSHEDAVIEKKAIEICKGNAKSVKLWLEVYGIVPAATAAKRREQVVQALKEGKG